MVSLVYRHVAHHFPMGPFVQTPTTGEILSSIDENKRFIAGICDVGYNRLIFNSIGILSSSPSKYCHGEALYMDMLHRFATGHVAPVMVKGSKSKSEAFLFH
jgi:hypothetical protein